MPNQVRNHQSGFTLIELCVALLIAIAVGLFAIPNLRHLQDRWALQSVTQGVMAMLSLARIEAMKSGDAAELCASVDRRNCANFDASSRYINVMHGNGNHLRRSMRLEDGYYLSGPVTRPRIRFLSNGWSSGSNLTLKVCDSNGIWRKEIIINNAGRARSQEHPGSDPC